jgi:hypothetical protein
MLPPATTPNVRGVCDAVSQVGHHVEMKVPRFRAGDVELRADGTGSGNGRVYVVTAR